MTAMQMYLLLKLDDVQCLLGVAGGLLGFALVLVVIIGVINKDMEKTPFPKKLSLSLGIPCLLCVVFAVLIPSTRQMAIIYVTPKIVNAVSNSEECRKIPGNILSLANAWIEELKPESKGSAKK